MNDITRRDTPQLCACGHPPLRCAITTLDLVQRAIRRDSRLSPACCLTIARKQTVEYANACRLTITTCAAVQEVLSALRDDDMGRTTASRCIANATLAIENIIAVSSRRAQRATVLLRRRFGKGACPLCGDEPSLRTAARQLSWCEAALRQSQFDPRALATVPGERNG
jgi:hypothetical protein